jgi:hypothetical protein
MTHSVIKAQGKAAKYIKGLNLEADVSTVDPDDSKKER